MHQLLEEEGYEGSYSTFTYQARLIEEELGVASKEAFVKLKYDGGVMQVDFGEMTVMDNGYPRKIIVFSAKPERIIFDNLKPAVKEVLQGSERVLQDEFLRFKSFYCFQAEFCGPGKGNEKGLIENLVKYTRNNYFLPYIDFKGFNKLNDTLYANCWNRMQTKKIVF